MIDNSELFWVGNFSSEGSRGIQINCGHFLLTVPPSPLASFALPTARPLPVRSLWWVRSQVSYARCFLCKGRGSWGWRLSSSFHLSWRRDRRPPPVCLLLLLSGGTVISPWGRAGLSIRCYAQYHLVDSKCFSLKIKLRPRFYFKPLVCPKRSISKKCSQANQLTVLQYHYEPAGEGLSHLTTNIDNTFTAATHLVFSTHLYFQLIGWFPLPSNELQMKLYLTD